MAAVPLAKKVMAEFIGTFILIFTVLSTIIMDEQHGGVESLLGIAASAGLAVTVLVLSIIHISGCHLNPAGKELIAVAVGATIMMNALVAGPSTGASMNPARTIGPAIVTGRYNKIWVYLVATALGAVAGTGAYVTIKL